MKGEASFTPPKSFWEQRRLVDRKAWQTEGSPFALFRTLREDIAERGASVETINGLFSLGTFVERAFLSSGKKVRQEEKSVIPVVHSYRVAIRFIEGTHLSPQSLLTYTAISLLHDVLEDTPVSSKVLRMKYGDTIADGVIALSKYADGRKISTDEYYKRLGNAEQKIQWIKVADRIENLSVFLRMSEVGDLLDTGKFRLPSGNGLVEAMKTNLEESQHYVVALAEGNPNLAKELQRVMLETEKRLKELQTQKKRRRLSI